MSKISVVTATIRPKGLPIVKQSLEKQSFQDFEWLIGSPFDPQMGEWVEDEFEHGFWTFNRIHNKLFSQAQGELIVSWQDWLWVGPEGLQKFWDDYQATKGQAAISGVGDQYEELDTRGKPMIKIWSDPRKTTQYGSFYECLPQDMEWNFGAMPKAMYWAAGGIDEKLDFLGFDGGTSQLDQRLAELGYKFYLDQDNESFTLRHDRSDLGGQLYWDENHVMFAQKDGMSIYDQRIKELKREGNWPIIK